MTESVLQNHNVLVIEDEYLVAMDLQDKLRDLGAVVVGPIGRLDEALAVIEAGTTIDSAVLDINLGGRRPIRPPICCCSATSLSSSRQATTIRPSPRGFRTLSA